MERIKQAGERTNETQEIAVKDDAAGDKELRALRDLEMVLVGGGSDGAVYWG